MTPVQAQVLACEQVTPSVVRVVLRVPGFTSLDVPDEGCVLGFPAPGSHVADAPDLAGGHWYTVRRVGPGTVTVDVVRHDSGAASAWADRAQVGDELQVGTQGSWFRRPADATWQLLAVDLTGLPACARIVEETPPGIRTIAVVEVPTAADEQPLGPGAEVTWVHNPDVVHGDSHLERAVRAVALPEGPGYVYVAGEAAATRAVRRYLRHDRGLPPAAYGVIGYWRRDAQAWARRVERAGMDLDRLWDEAEAVATDEEHALDLVEERLDKAGLL